MNDYLLDTTGLLAAFEADLDFNAFIGDETTDIATEATVKERMVKIGEYIKNFFAMLWNAITRFIKDLTGETLIYKIGESHIKSAIADFTKVFNNGLLKIATAANNGEVALEEEINKFKEDIDSSITGSTQLIDRAITLLKEKEKDVKKSQAEKENAVPVKAVKDIIQKEYNILKGATSKFNSVLNGKADATNKEIELCNRAAKVALDGVNSLYNLLFKAIKGFKVHFRPNIK